MRGWIYIITNKAMPGLVKVGFSMKDPEIRARELGGTGLPHEYVVDYEVLVEEPQTIEQAVHRRLGEYRESKEWFRCRVEEGVAAIKEIAGKEIQIENYKHADREKAEAILRQQEAEERRRCGEKVLDEFGIRDAEKRRKEREAFIIQQRKEILARYERVLQETLPHFGCLTSIALYVLFIIVSKGVSSPLKSIIEKNLGVFFLGIFIFSILAFLLEKFFKKRAKRSPRYLSVIAKRDAELEKLERMQAEFRAAEQGKAEARLHLGEMYEDGKDIQQDNITAYAWYVLAAESGHDCAPDKLKRLERMMIPEAILHARNLARGLSKLKK